VPDVIFSTSKLNEQQKAVILNLPSNGFEELEEHNVISY
jgi:hypothetical protein